MARYVGQHARDRVEARLLKEKGNRQQLHVGECPIIDGGTRRVGDQVVTRALRSALTSSPRYCAICCCTPARNKPSACAASLVCINWSIHPRNFPDSSTGSPMIFMR